jgi:hypothetical protein
MTVYCDSLEGMWGPITDPGIFQFTKRIAAEISGINVDGSPVRDYAVNDVVARIIARPAGSINLLVGTSLGCNNLPVIAAYVHMQNPKITIHGMWGFQASMYGAKAQDGTDYVGIPPNVLFAHLTRSDTIIPVPGIGAYSWIKAPGNVTTGLVIDTVDDVHPGDGNVVVQDSYLAEMRRVINAA